MPTARPSIIARMEGDGARRERVRRCGDRGNTDADQCGEQQQSCRDQQPEGDHQHDSGDADADDLGGARLGHGLECVTRGAGSPGVRRRGRGGPRCGFREVLASCAQGKRIKRVEVHDAGVLHGVRAARLSRDLEGHRFTARYCP